MSKQENKFTEIVKASEVIETTKSGELKGGFQIIGEDPIEDDDIIPRINIFGCDFKP
ncbi:hypothetical protein [Faecalibacter rhinopitheci]|uniref:Uncharacterized protein n=1 Tax=Faecalibacter rhinopitheci TaxID=2779678 RepID=A0A8J7K5F0_9FLAO|nr:hypothetical protein [Faecalibacter rhinopitheci]MBF0598298.1 hypothetical protein [Faecalibacter rhinopitheci]